MRTYKLSDYIESAWSYRLARNPFINYPLSAPRPFFSSAVQAANHKYSTGHDIKLVYLCHFDFVCMSVSTGCDLCFPISPKANGIAKIFSVRLCNNENSINYFHSFFVLLATSWARTRCRWSPINLKSIFPFSGVNIITQRFIFCATCLVCKTLFKCESLLKLNWAFRIACNIMFFSYTYQNWTVPW